MTLTVSQIREARRLLRRSSAALSAQAGVSFRTVLQAQLDAEISSVDTSALQAIEDALVRAGVRFAADGSVSRRKTRSPVLAATDPGRSSDV